MKKLIIYIFFIQVGFASNIPLVSGVTVSGTVTQGEMKYYELNASRGETVESIIEGLSADADIFVKIDTRPTQELFDCKSTNGSQSADQCSLILDKNSTVFIAVYGYRSANYKVKATAKINPDGIPLTSGIPFSSSVLKNEINYYTIDAKSGDTIEALIDNLDADSDVYIEVGSKPLLNSFACKSAHGGTKIDKCSVFLTEDSRVYIGVYGYETTQYKVRVLKNLINLEHNISVTGSVEENQINFYKIPAQFKDTVSASIDNLTADADIFIKLGSSPTTSSYDCKSENGQMNKDECLLLLMDDLDVYIAVFGFRKADYHIEALINRPIVPLYSTVYEDAENGPSPEWIHERGQYLPLVVPTPNIVGAPEGNSTLVLVPEGAGAVSHSRYILPINNSTQKILEMDCGGLPDYLLPTYGGLERRKGYIVHYAVGLSIETTQGPRRMLWYSYFNHVHTENFREVISEDNIWLNYQSPVETTSGYYQPIDVWRHFRVDVEKELQKLEPGNRLLKINHLFATGGFLDNIKLSTN